MEIWDLFLIYYKYKYRKYCMYLSSLLFALISLFLRLFSRSLSFSRSFSTQQQVQGIHCLLLNAGLDAKKTVHIS